MIASPTKAQGLVIDCSQLDHAGVGIIRPKREDPGRQQRLVHGLGSQHVSARMRSTESGRRGAQFGTVAFFTKARDCILTGIF
jgi:hypothetical protein